MDKEKITKEKVVDTVASAFGVSTSDDGKILGTKAIIQNVCLITAWLLGELFKLAKKALQFMFRLLYKIIIGFEYNGKHHRGILVFVGDKLKAEFTDERTKKELRRLSPLLIIISAMLIFAYADFCKDGKLSADINKKINKTTTTTVTAPVTTTVPVITSVTTTTVTTTTTEEESMRSIEVF